MYYVYLLECHDRTLYCGYTNNLELRLQVHNSGKGAKYTKYRLPVKLVFCQSFDTKSEALKQEYNIKQLSRHDKLKMIIESNDIVKSI